MRSLPRVAVSNGFFKCQAPLAFSKTRRFLSQECAEKATQRVQAESLAIEQDLNYNPQLTMAEKGINLLITVGACGMMLLISRKPLKEIISIPYILCMAIICSLIAYIVYAVQMYRRYNRLKRSEMELKSSNSKWIDMQQEDGGSVRLHCRVEVPHDTDVSCAIHCVHGFGSHSFSYSFVQKRLAHALSSLVTSHDMCGFGLSQRPLGYLPYTMKFHGHASVYILEKMLQETSQAGTRGRKVKKILIGHSLGCSAICEALIENSDISGAIMIAPAILSYNKRSRNRDERSRSATVMAAVDSLVENEDSMFDLDWDQIGTGLRKTLLSVKAIIMAIVSEIVTGILFLLSPLLKILLGVAVFPRTFWDFGLASAVKTRESFRDWDTYVDNYRIPVLVKGWEEGLLRFVFARITRKKGIVHALKQIWQSKDSLPQAHRLADANSAPILIVHGRQDLIVPLVNSERLAEYIPNTSLKVFESCGHQPHEELPEEFLQIAQEFIESL